MMRLVLLIVGVSILLVTGVLVILAKPTGSNVLNADPFTVNIAPCFKCHLKEQNVFDTLTPEPAVTDSELNVSLTVLDLQGEAYTLPNPHIALTSPHPQDQPPQRYILQTGDSYAIQPRQWNLTAMPWLAENTAVWLANCSQCHTHSTAPLTAPE